MLAYVLVKSKYSFKKKCYSQQYGVCVLFICDTHVSGFVLTKRLEAQIVSSILENVLLAHLMFQGFSQMWHHDKCKKCTVHPKSNLAAVCES